MSITRRRKVANGHRPTEQGPKGRRGSAWRWIGFLAAPVALIGFVLVSLANERDERALDEAVPFQLIATDGATVSLDDVLAQGDALLYFSMGVGCDGCFFQIPEIAVGVAERGMTLVPIMIDPAPMVAAEAARFAIDAPILIDPGAQVSRSYEMLGIYGHFDRPSHSFALVHQDGSIGWVRHYAEMFVSSEALFSELDASHGA